MLHVFSINLVKLMTRKPKTTVILGRGEYMRGYRSMHVMFFFASVSHDTYFIKQKRSLTGYNIPK
jgi:hypothetical protein